jgi:ubiquinone/menaquinone biosynthesis C-methylase UbiE
MATIDENKRAWDKAYEWPQAGDEWSSSWGSPRAQWEGCLLPRIFPFLRGRILEIAPGRGRWTQFLEAHCTSLIGIDVSASCIAHCKQRFEGYANLDFSENDGRTLPMVESASIDFAFSFDSLVHAESDAVDGYVAELARVLKPGAVAFIHHSNLGAPRSVWYKLRRRMSRLPFHTHWRAPSMSAAKMRQFVERSGISCLQQELVPWGDGWPMLIDCMSTIVNLPRNKCVVIENPRFMEEAAATKRISSYAPLSDPLHAASD